MDAAMMFRPNLLMCSKPQRTDNGLGACKSSTAAETTHESVWWDNQNAKRREEDDTQLGACDKCRTCSTVVAHTATGLKSLQSVPS